MNNDIIIIGQQPWDTEIGSNCKNIALELSKTNRVLYVNSPLDRITLLKNKNDPKIQKRLKVIKHKEQGLVKIQENLWNYYPDCIVESINWIPFRSVFRVVNKFNNRRLTNSLLKPIKELSFNNFILFNDNEMFKGFYLKDFLKPLLSIYYSRDYMIGVDYWKKHGEVLEGELITKSDVCFANSEYLAAYCRKYNSNAFYVGQGCDIESFKELRDFKPEPLREISSPIIGYVGAVSSSRLSIETIGYIANHFNSFTIVLVGPEDDSFENSSLHQIKNIQFLGQQKVDDLPYFINAFDVCINPQVVNAITKGNYPRKIDEYLALGKPVVATRTETMEAFSDYVYLADTKEEYVQLIEFALKENTEEKERLRKEFAFSHTWENSVGKMVVEIKKVMNDKS